MKNRSQNFSKYASAAIATLALTCAGSASAQYGGGGGAAGGAGGAGAIRSDVVPPELQGVGVTEKLGQPIPLELMFKDESGKAVKLRDYFRSGKPVILAPVYLKCPMLCKLTLNGLVDGLNQIEWSAGQEFEIIALSFNPAEGPELAHLNKRAYLTQYRRESAEAGLHILTGQQRDIEALMKSIGFGYRPDGKGDFAHSSTIVFLTPDGKISRYMNDVLYKPRDLRLALIEASQGAIGSPMEHFLLLMCYKYDPDSNSYAASAIKIMRLGGLATLTLMLAGFFVLWLRGGGRQAGTPALQAASTTGSESRAANIDANSNT